jgi:hypothetical protein
MYLRSMALAATIGIAGTAFAEELKPEEARRFVAGKLFSYTCFEGTNGSGRIFADGSVAGTIQLGGQGPVRYAQLPPGTIRVSTESICASVRGVPFNPCFNVDKTDAMSFRGSLSGFGFAYCNFTRRNPRGHMVRAAATTEPMSIDPATTGSVPAASGRAAAKPVHSSAVILRKSQD